MRIDKIGIDLAKETFHIYGINSAGEKIVSKKLAREKFALYFTNLETCSIFMEACGGANYWGRTLRKMGHTVKLISPQHVKPFVGSQKNDCNDARAILEASRRLEAKFVAIKELWQQDIQCLHRAREGRVKNRVALSNQIRGLLMEYGITIKRGKEHLKKNMTPLLEDAESGLTTAVRELLYELYEEYLAAESRVIELTLKIQEISKQHEVCQQLEVLPGVGPIISTMFAASIGDPAVFKNGRQVAAWLGLVPKQVSTGGKTKLLGITKNGDSYLRKMVVQGARSRLMSIMRKKKHTEEEERILQMQERKGFNKTAVALANRNTRKMWHIMANCS